MVNRARKAEPTAPPEAPRRALRPPPIRPNTNPQQSASSTDGAYWLAHVAATVAQASRLRLEDDADRAKALRIAQVLISESLDIPRSAVERARAEGYREGQRASARKLDQIRDEYGRLLDWSLGFPGVQLIAPVSKISGCVKFAKVLQLLLPRTKGPGARLSRFKSWLTSRQRHLRGGSLAKKELEAALDDYQRKEYDRYCYLSLARDFAPWLAAKQKSKKRLK